MIRSRIGVKATVAVMALLGGGVLGACRSSGHRDGFARNGTAESEDEVVGHAPTHLGGPQGGAKTHPLRIRPTPDMNKDIDSMSDTELVGYLASLEYDTDPGQSQLVAADCVHTRTNARCAPGDEANVYIEPEVGAHLKPFPAKGSHGFIVARIINYDPSDRKELTFGIEPSHRVWWVVDNDAAGNPRSRFFQRGYVTDTVVKWVGVTRPFSTCIPPHAPARRAKARFGTCNYTPPSKMAMAGDAVKFGASPSGDPSYFHAVSLGSAVPVTARRAPFALNGGWISCPSGCCSTQ